MDPLTANYSVLAFILGVFFFIVGIAWLVFPFIVLGRMAEQRDSIEEGNKRLMALHQETVKTNNLLSEMIEDQRARDARAVASKMLTISRDGQEWGTRDISEVRAMIASGELTHGDHYFDDEISNWVTLASHPDLVS